MVNIEIGAGAILVALGGLGLQGSLSFNVAVLILGTLLFIHGIYNVFFKPRVRLQQRVRNWLLNRHWSVSKDEQANFRFVIAATDESGRKVIVTQDRGADRGILAFTARVPIDASTAAKMTHLSPPEQVRLTEDIIVLLASLQMGWAHARWPLNQLAVQTALPLDHSLSEHRVDVTAKAVLNATVAARSMIRRAVAHIP